MFTFHVLGVPHAVFDETYSACAFSKNALTFAKQMKDNGHMVYLYGNEKSTIRPCDKFINTVSSEYYDDFFKTASHPVLRCQGDEPIHELHCAIVIQNLLIHAKPNDFVVHFWPDTRIVQETPKLIHVDGGIGNTRLPICPNNIYETYAVHHTCLGLSQKNANAYDAVIPSPYDESLFEFNSIPQNYILFMARLNWDKGVDVAVSACRAANVLLKIAGQGTPPVGPGIEYQGVVGYQKRKELMMNAKALILPTLYTEPYGNVTIEAMACGTPIITTDWGCFTENNIHGITGFRCRTMGDFVWALRNIDTIDRKKVFEFAKNNFSMEAVYPKRLAYFKRLHGLHTGASDYYTIDPDQKGIILSEKYYPLN